jgi:hypothetical protein
MLLLLLLQLLPLRLPPRLKRECYVTSSSSTVEGVRGGVGLLPRLGLEWAAMGAMSRLANHVRLSDRLSRPHTIASCALLTC